MTHRSIQIYFNTVYPSHNSSVHIHHKMARGIYVDEVSWVSHAHMLVVVKWTRLVANRLWATGIQKVKFISIQRRNQELSERVWLHKVLLNAFLIYVYTYLSTGPLSSSTPIVSFPRHATTVLNYHELDSALCSPGLGLCSSLLHAPWQMEKRVEMW